MRRSDQRRDAVFALYQHEVTGRPLEELLEGAKPFTRELAEGTEANREELDGLIARHAKGWALERIAPLERSIMRVALYEALHRDDVPVEVAIDEAVELAKEYCGAEAPGFVNGDPRRCRRDQPSRLERLAEPRASRWLGIEALLLDLDGVLYVEDEAVARCGRGGRAAAGRRPRACASSPTPRCARDAQTLERLDRLGLRGRARGAGDAGDPRPAALRGGGHDSVSRWS